MRRSPPPGGEQFDLILVGPAAIAAQDRAEPLA
jgi:hypothetical protein